MIRRNENGDLCQVIDTPQWGVNTVVQTPIATAAELRAAGIVLVSVEDAERLQACERACQRITDWCTEHDRADLTSEVELLAAFEAVSVERDELREQVLALRQHLAQLPIGAYDSSAALQAWWDHNKEVLERTNPVWLSSQEEADRLRTAIGEK